MGHVYSVYYNSDYIPRLQGIKLVIKLQGRDMSCALRL